MMKATAHDRPMEILAPEDNPPFSQIEQTGKDGAPHRALLPERLRGREIKVTGLSSEPRQLISK